MIDQGILYDQCQTVGIHAVYSSRRTCHRDPEIFQVKISLVLTILVHLDAPLKDSGRQMFLLERESQR